MTEEEQRYITDYLSGNLAPEERKRFSEWLAERPERQEAFREAQLRLPRLLAAPEAPMQDGRPRNRPFKGVNEYYVPCLLPPEAAQAAETHRLIPVRPLELTPKGLRVALLDEAR